MPNDENCDRSFDISDVLNELSLLINFYDGYIITGGDFNVDFVRNADLLEFLLNEENLLCPPLSSTHATYTY